MSGQREALVEVLAAHRYVVAGRCSCGFPSVRAVTRAEVDAHLADAILAALPEVKP